jgi:hypothetical protein
LIAVDKSGARLTWQNHRALGFLLGDVTDGEDTKKKTPDDQPGFRQPCMVKRIWGQ